VEGDQRYRYRTVLSTRRLLSQSFLYLKHFLLSRWQKASRAVQSLELDGRFLEVSGWLDTSPIGRRIFTVDAHPEVQPLSLPIPMLMAIPSSASLTFVPLSQSMTGLRRVESCGAVEDWWVRECVHSGQKLRRTCIEPPPPCTT
jgi:hypothetical protein